MIQFVYPPGATPIDPDEAAGLIPTHISTLPELDELEATNIQAAHDWASRSRSQILTSQYVKELHRRMLSDVWEWAGKFRRSGKNLGVDWQTIPVVLEELLRNVEYQVRHNAYGPDELAARFHHRLVLIHCFPNGNGRHARLIADVLLTRQLNQPAFSWGAGSGEDNAAIRTRYMAALHAADAGDIRPLLGFIRS